MIVLGLLSWGCKPDLNTSAPPADAPATQVAASGAALMVGAGDVARCDMQGDEATAVLTDSVIRASASAGVETIVFTTGDHAYPAGLDRDFVRCFTPSWGDRRKQIMNLIRPVIGNHDYQSRRGNAYYRYFGTRAGEAGKGYYSYDVGRWHAIALNSEIVVFGSASEIRAQYDWLRKDLSDHRNPCTVAYFHRPLFSSGSHGSDQRLKTLWTVLQSGGVDLILAGHDHHYERFAPQNAAGAADSLSGIAEIVVGTGGGPLTGLHSPLAANSVARVQGHYGILLLTLAEGEYRHAFMDTDGRVWDEGGRRCH